MGAVVSVLSAALPAAAVAITGLLSMFSQRDAAPNPVLGAIEDHDREALEDAARNASEEAAAARASQAEFQQLAANSERMAEEAIAARKRAEEQASKLREEYARREREENARHAREDAERKAREEAARRTQEEIVSKAREYARNVEVAQADADNARRAQMEAERQAYAAKREAAAAEEEIKKAKKVQEEAKRATDVAVKDANEQRAAREKAEADLKKGVQPVEWPTRLELNQVKRNYQYREGIFHFAVAGISGSGKSSLINALCGYSNSNRRAAKTGIVETTSQVARYPDPNPQNPFAWYDVPGAGTLDIPDWQYFNAQGLYVFDCIIVLFDNRFTATDVAILRNCQRYNIPSYIVRSKANQHIQNIVADMYQQADDEDEGPDDDEAHKSRKYAELYPVARDIFIQKTRKNVEVNLQKADLPRQRVYIVSKDAMLTIIKGKVPKGFIDEYDLLRDMLAEAEARRLRGKAKAGDSEKV